MTDDEKPPFSLKICDGLPIIRDGWRAIHLWKPKFLLKIRDGLPIIRENPLEVTATWQIRDASVMVVTFWPSRVLTITGFTKAPFESDFEAKFRVTTQYLQTDVSSTVDRQGYTRVHLVWTKWQLSLWNAQRRHYILCKHWQLNGRQGFTIKEAYGEIEYSEEVL